MIELILPTGRGANRLAQQSLFSVKLMELGEEIGMKISSRGWCYQLEDLRLINKNEFDKCEKIINDCRKLGLLPVDFVAEESSRQFSGVEKPETETPLEYFADYLRTTLNCYNMYIPDWWEDEQYYIQMVVEKVDLVNLFSPICQQYHIPIATAKGWSSILQRAEYCRRFKDAEDQGLECVLLYCGDHDPDGLRIGEFLMNNISELKDSKWGDGTDGYDPENLVIDRFGLNYDFIEANHLTSIDNLKTGAKTKDMDLSYPSHPNHKLPYVQEYIKNYGVRKWEANALITRRDQARKLCRDAIEHYLGHDAISRFQEKRKAIKEEVIGFMEERNLRVPLQKMLDDLDGES